MCFTNSKGSYVIFIIYYFSVIQSPFYFSLLHLQVDAYGFMSEEFKKYSNYYYDKYVKTRVIFYSNHDYILEKNTWKNLHNSKILNLYQGE